MKGCAGHSPASGFREKADDEDDDPSSPLAAEMAMYNFLSWLLDSAVTALMQG